MLVLERVASETGKPMKGFTLGFWGVEGFRTFLRFFLGNYDKSCSQDRVIISRIRSGCRGGKPHHRYSVVGSGRCSKYDGKHEWDLVMGIMLDMLYCRSCSKCLSQKLP